MKLSHSLHRGILEATVGALFNQLMMSSVRRRRNTLFFEGIVAEYILLCEKSGYADRMFSIGHKWFSIIFSRLFSSRIWRMSPIFVLGNVLRPLWISLGVLDDMKAEQHGRELSIVTYNDSITRLIGPNQFYVGMVVGGLSLLFGKKVRCIKAVQTRAKSSYRLVLLNEPPMQYPSLSLDAYNEKNRFTPESGFNLPMALKQRMFTLAGNRILFRGKGVWHVENTVFHLFSSEKILLGKVPRISYNYFKGIIQKETGSKEKLRLLKTLLQVMGWGQFSFRVQEKSIVVKATNLPVGFQKEKGDWTFLFKVMEGYIWLINKKYQLVSLKQARTSAIASYFLVE